MKTFSFYQIFHSIVCMFIFGIACGGIRGATADVFQNIKRIILVPIELLFGNSDLARTKKTSKERRDHINDFLFILLTGIVYILLSYVILDGVARLYTLLIALLSFILSQKTLGVIFNKILSFIFFILYKVAYWILFPVIKPVRLLMLLLYKPIRLIITRLKACIYKINLEKRIKKKRKHCMTG